MRKKLQKNREKIKFGLFYICQSVKASAVGVAAATNNSDLFFGNHRSHAHYLAKNGNLEKMMMEIFGDERVVVKDLEDQCTCLIKV